MLFSVGRYQYQCTVSTCPPKPFSGSASEVKLNYLQNFYFDFAQYDSFANLPVVTIYDN